jgi:glycosyltransferase involved in cell wall biosynthesis
MRILQVSTADMAGGAERIAWNLFHAYRDAGHVSSLAVGIKRTDDPGVVALPNGNQWTLWTRGWWAVERRVGRLEGHVPGAGFISRFTRYAARPRTTLLDEYGIENFHFRGTRRLLGLPAERPEIVHCHNLHGGYFDLRVLPRLSHAVPVVMTLHDAWLLSGHCAHSFDCDRWRSGCGHCPDLGIYPPLKRDSTAYNWRRKQRIFAKSRLHVATPSAWLMRKVEDSILAPAIVESRVIPNGVDLGTFRLGDRAHARAMLNIPPDARVILFTGYGIRRNIWKDYETMRAAISRAAEQLRGENVLFIGLGEESPPERMQSAEFRFVGYVRDGDEVARYYQAADMYIHAARADTFPNSVLEALACGIPVVATAVGGIPEQLKPLGGLGNGAPEVTRHGPEDATGILVAAGDAEDMARSLVALIRDAPLRARLGANANADAKDRFDLERQARTYLEWYRQLLLPAREVCTRGTAAKHANADSCTFAESAAGPPAWSSFILHRSSVTRIRLHLPRRSA